jgi:O-antigen/teichoic acid export membrane protein
VSLLTNKLPAVEDAIFAVCPPFVKERLRRVAASPLSYRLLHGTFWSLMGAVIARFLGFAASILVARWLGREGFGRLGVIQSTVAMFQVFAAFGLGLTATKYVSEFRTHDPGRTGRIIGLSHLVATVSGAVMSAVLFFSADWLSSHTLAAPELAPLLRIAAPVLLFSSINGSQMGALSGFEAFKDVAQVNLIAGLLTFPLTIVGTLLWGLTGATASLLASLVITCCLSQVRLRVQARKYFVPIQYSGPHDWLVLWRFTVPAVLGGAMVPPVNWVCVALLVNSPGGYSAMGLFNAANQWRNLLMFIPGIMMQAALPIMSAAHSNGETTPDFYHTLKMAQNLIVAVAFPVATILMFGSGIILHIYGRGFYGGESVVIGLIATTLIQCIGAASGTAIEARGRMWMGLLLNGSWAASYLGFVYLTVTHLGANSLAFGLFVSYLVVTLSTFIYLESQSLLPDGMLKRGLLSLSLVFMLVASVLVCSPSLRLILLLPVTVLVTLLTFISLIDKDLIRALRSLVGLNATTHSKLNRYAELPEL